MKLFTLAALAASMTGALAQEPVAGIPRIGRIEFYGLHRVSENLIRQALGVSEGEPLPPSKTDAEERILDIDRVVSAQLQAVCCDGGKTILYVGIEEFGAPRYEVRPPPGSSADLLLKTPALEDLHTALTDNDSAVRSIAVKGLLARKGVPPEWFIPMLQSIDWSDRTQSVFALEQLTRGGAKASIARLRGAPLDSLIEMSRWRDEQYAYPAFLLVGRVAGFTDLNIRDAWLRAGRDSVIAKAKAVK
jgi:hypothetical protein